jgi:hypothetical protein
MFYRKMNCSITLSLDHGNETFVSSFWWPFMRNTIILKWTILIALDRYKCKIMSNIPEKVYFQNKQKPKIEIKLNSLYSRVKFCFLNHNMFCKSNQTSFTSGFKFILSIHDRLNNKNNHWRVNQRFNTVKQDIVSNEYI